MEEGRLAYRVRTAEAGDATLSSGHHDDAGASRPSRPPRELWRRAGRGDILVLERYDRPAHEWHVAGFIECHMRVDDNLSIRDVGTTGDEPQTGVVRYLLDQAFNSFGPAGRRSRSAATHAPGWTSSVASPASISKARSTADRTTGRIWRWDRQHARRSRAAGAAAGRATAAARPRPRPPRPPRRAATASAPTSPAERSQTWRADPRPADQSGPPRSRGPRRPRPPSSS